MTAPPIPRSDSPRKPAPRTLGYVLAFRGELPTWTGTRGGHRSAVSPGPPVAQWTPPDPPLLARVLDGLRRSRDESAALRCAGTGAA
ncbi:MULTISPECIES: hypothetical protein [unclassified Actinopolyspora]|uniref:hypothetical protein n=1 Tax=unclassified Actinopolyspora TaxID=2639451 RepID=UPI0013F5F6FA|nr:MULTISPECIES: hypothetical protein [unclassified Actinopolyspora]NHD18757.1 hypothetical protein [Actinopolyspora sp. BKK2]NHE77921.1 hypothetical protein [Actinopolyspora sp. BKK1]